MNLYLLKPDVSEWEEINIKYILELRKNSNRLEANNVMRTVVFNKVIAEGKNEPQTCTHAK